MLKQIPNILIVSHFQISIALTILAITPRY